MEDLQCGRKYHFFGIPDDYRRYRLEGCRSLGSILLCQGFWAICEYRVAHAATRIRIPVVRDVMAKFFVVTQKLIQVLTGIHLPRICRIGNSLYIPHSGPIFIGEAVAVGDFCTIHPGVVIGSAGRCARRGCPSLGDRVFVGVNAIILGKVSVGNDSAIGAGTVVLKDVAASSVMVGNPARCLNTAGSGDLIRAKTECGASV